MKLIHRIPRKMIVNEQIPFGYEGFVFVWTKETLDIYREVC